MTVGWLHRHGYLGLWLLLTLTVCLRPPLPIDETRYLSVAWEMWLRGDFLVPYLNGQPYSHKPPLLFWLFHCGWALFGVNDWWPALVGPLAALGNLLLTIALARRLWPRQPEIARLAPWILVATLLWTLFATTAMFDMLLTCFVLLALLGLLEAAAGRQWRGWGLFAAAVGLGLLAKGPVMFLHVLPVALLVSFWNGGGWSRRWLAGLAGGLLAGATLALAWAVPAALAGGAEYGHAILWRQAADRAIATEIHVRPLGWYLPFLPAVLFPWVFWPRLWSGLVGCTLTKDHAARFCVIWLLAGLLLFSVLGSKQIHYLIPLLPAYALLVARLLVAVPVAGGRGDLLLPLVFTAVGLLLTLLPVVPGLSALRWVQAVQPAWGLSILAVAVLLATRIVSVGRLDVPVLAAAVVGAVCVSVFWFFAFNQTAFDLGPAAWRVKSCQQRGIPVAFVGNYQGQLNFLGRLQQPLPVLPPEAAAEWALAHPDGELVSLERLQPQTAVFLQAHREYWLVFRAADQYWQLSPL